MSELTALADIVVSQLNAAELGEAFEAERIYIPTYDTAMTSTLKVFVLALAEQIDNASRSQNQHTYTVKVAIYKRVDQNDITTIDAMDTFRQAMLNFFIAHTQAGDNALTDINSEPVYDPAQLDKHNTYVSVIELTYENYI